VIVPVFLFFLSGLFLGSYLPFLPGLAFLVLLMTGLILTWLEWASRLNRGKGALLFGAFLCGVVYWTAWASVQNQSNLAQWVDRGVVTVRGAVVAPIRREPDRLAIRLSVASVKKGSNWYPSSGTVRLIWRHPDRPIYQGNRIEVVTKLRKPSGALNPGGFNYGAYLQQHGIQAVAWVSGIDHLHVIHSDHTEFMRDFWSSVDHWRSQVQAAAVSTLHGPAVGLFLGMIIGEQSFISQEVRDSFMTTGTVHIISISGSHLGLIAFLTFFLVKGAVLRLPDSWLQWLSLRVTATRFAALLTIPFVAFYTLLAGAEIATVRSLLMILLYLLTVWIGRKQAIILALVLAAFVTLLHNPQALYDISFQLSYVSVLAMGLWLQGQPRFLGEDTPWGDSITDSSREASRNWLIQTLQVTAVVVLATLPLVAYSFQQIAWVGLFANLLVVPYVGFVVVPLGLFSAIWVIVAGTGHLPLGFLNQLTLDLLTDIVGFVSRIPGAEWHVASPALVSIVLFYALGLWAFWGTRRPWIQRCCAIGMVLLLVWWVWSPRVGVEQERLRVTFLDVGQGDAIVVELPGHQTVLIDGGPVYTRVGMGRAVVGPFLWDRGVKRIDHMIATHPQWDHMGGLAWLIKKFDIGHYWSNGDETERIFYRRVQRALQAAGLTKDLAQKGKLITKAGPCTLMVLNPPAGQPSGKIILAARQNGGALNNRSVITYLDCGVHSFLFTADAERSALGRLSQMPHPPAARVVKVPHHGAKSSLNRQWIHQLKAEIAVVSVGKHNRYGHPVPSVMKAYREKGMRLYRTDRDGAVWITANLHSPEMTVHTAREYILQPVPIDSSFLKQEWKNWQRLGAKWMGYV